MYANSLCSIIFIDIPYHSITIANKCISEGTFGSKSDSSISIKRDNKAKSAKFEGKGRGKYPSLVINKLRSGKRTVMLKTNIDKELNNQVDYYNQQIKLINYFKYKSTRLSQDLISSGKNRYSKGRCNTNYGLLKDGVHPTITLVKLWIYKFIQLSVEVCEASGAYDG